MNILHPIYEHTKTSDFIFQVLYDQLYPEPNNIIHYDFTYLSDQKKNELYEALHKSEIFYNKVTPIKNPEFVIL